MSKYIHGKKMERRTCECGCKRKFWASEFSDAKFFSLNECAQGNPAWGRLQFTGATSPEVKQARLEAAAARSRNFSKWDRR